MDIIRKLAYAKLNLDLHVVRRRQDGFHELKSIVIPLDFYDEVYLEISNKNEVISNVQIKNNLVKRVIEEFQNRKHIDKNVKVTIYKKIPLASGLGGGSANAAAVINGIVELFNLQLPPSELEDIANKLGSDILFCLYNKPAIIQGRGDKLEFIDYPYFETITLILLPTKNNTAEVFKNHKIKENRIDFKRQIELFSNKDPSKYLYNIKNDLLESALKTNYTFDIYYQKIKENSSKCYDEWFGPYLIYNKF